MFCSVLSVAASPREPNMLCFTAFSGEPNMLCFTAFLSISENAVFYSIFVVIIICCVLQYFERYCVSGKSEYAVFYSIFVDSASPGKQNVLCFAVY